MTIRENVYLLAQKIVEAEALMLETRHRSVADLVESAIVWYVKQNYPELYEKIKEKIEKEVVKKVI